MSFSRKQIITIEGYVTKAFKLHDDLDLLDLPGDLDGEAKTVRRKFWRKRELCRVVGQKSYNSCDSRRDYLTVKAHFQRLAGLENEAEQTRQKGEWGSAATHTTGCAALRQLRKAQREAGLSDAYVAKIAAAKFRGESDLRQLSEKQLWHLCYTIRNRANAKLGNGETGNRNKKQRRARQ